MAATKRKPRKAPARPPAARTVYVGGRPMGAQQGQRREITPRQMAAAPGQAAAAVTQRGTSYDARHMLTAELIFGVLIVAIRAVADYEPQADGTLKGKIGHPKGQYGPLPILAGLIVTFFLLSFLAASGGTKAKLAVIFGGTVDIALLLKSTDELKTVSNVFGTFGKAKVPPGSWQTSGTEAGALIQGTLPASGSGGDTGPPLPKGAPPGAIPMPASGQCPSGFIAGAQGPGKPQWCAPTMG